MEFASSRRRRVQGFNFGPKAPESSKLIVFRALDSEYTRILKVGMRLLGP